MIDMENKREIIDEIKMLKNNIDEHNEQFIKKFHEMDMKMMNISLSISSIDEFMKTVKLIKDKIYGKDDVLGIDVRLDRLEVYKNNQKTAFNFLWIIIIGIITKLIWEHIK